MLWISGTTDHSTLRHIKRAGSRLSLCGRKIYGRGKSRSYKRISQWFLTSNNLCKQCVVSLHKKMQ